MQANGMKNHCQLKMGGLPDDVYIKLKSNGGLSDWDRPCITTSSNTGYACCFCVQTDYNNL